MRILEHKLVGAIMHNYYAKGEKEDKVKYKAHGTTTELAHDAHYLTSNTVREYLR